MKTLGIVVCALAALASLIVWLNVRTCNKLESEEWYD